MHRVHVVVSGQVQGVGFRWFVRQNAKALGVHGWVRNRVDGCVEAEAEGSAEALAAFLAALREGPSRARVEHVTEQHEDGPARHQGFTISG